MKKNFTRNLFNSLMPICIGFLLLLMPNLSIGQVLAWQLNGAAGNQNSSNSTTTDASLATSSLTRGSGVNTANAANSYAASSFSTTATSLANAISANDYFQFTVNPDAGYIASLSTLNVKLFRSAANAPSTFQWQYSTNGTTFTSIGSSFTYTGTTADGDAQTAVDLSGISALQSTTNTITFRLYAWNGTSSTAIVAIGKSASNTENVLSLSGTVAPESPTKLVITSVSPTSPIAGQTFTVTVQAQNASNVASNVVANTTVSLSTNLGTLSGTTTGTINAGSNSITFTGLSLSTAGNATLTAARTAGDVLTSGTSNVTVQTAATKFSINTINTQNAGVSFSVTVRSQDASNTNRNVINATAFTLSTNGNAGAIGGTITGTIPAGSSTATVTGVILPNGGTGVTITATQTSGDPLTAGTSATFTVNPPASKFAIISISPTSPTAGSGFSVVVQAQDVNNTSRNVLTNTSFSLSTNGNAGTIGGTVTGTINAGSNSVTVTGVTLSTEGSLVTLTAARTSGDNLSDGTSGTFTVLPPASQLAFVNVPTNGIRNTVISTFTVEARRPDNSVDNTYTGNITVAKATGSGTLSGTLTKAAVAGIAIFNDLQFNADDTYTLNASSGSLTAATSGSIIIFTSNASDQFRSKATGSWSSASSWESSADGISWGNASLTPTSTAAAITIQNTHNISVTANVTADQINVASGGTLTVNNVTLTLNNGTGTDLNVFGTVTVSGNGGTITTNAGATIVFDENSQYNHQRGGNNAGNIPTATWHKTSLCNVTGITSNAPGGFGQIFGKFTWNCTNQSSSFTINTTSFNPEGLFTVSSTGSSTLGLDNSGTYVFGDGLLINGGTLLLNVTTNGNTTNEVVVQITGDLTVAGTGKCQFGTGTSSAETNPYMARIELTGNINLSISSTTQYPLECTASNFYGRIVLTGVNVTQEYTRTSTLSGTKIHYEIPSGKTLLLNNNLLLRSSSSTNFDKITVDGTLNTGSNAVANSSGSNTQVAVSASATIITAHANGLNTAIGASTRTFDVGASYVFNGATTTAFPTTAQQTTFGNPSNIKVNANITLNRTLTMTGILNLSSGILTLANNSLTINSTGSITGGSATSYVATTGTGRVIRRGVLSGTTGFFPVGTATAYNPVTITEGGNIDYTVGVSATTPSGTGITQPTQVINRIWTITPASLASNITLAFTYNAGEGAANFVDGGTKDGANFNSSLNAWQYIGMSSSVGTNPYTVTFGGFSFPNLTSTQFSFANSGALLSTELISFKAKSHGKQNELVWQTATETNSSHIHIQRSNNGSSDWQTIGQLKAFGKSETVKDYQFVDFTPLSISYYRLQLVDLDGSSTLSHTVSVISSSDSKLDVYPTMTKDKLTISLDNNQTQNYHIFNLLGQIVQSGTFIYQKELTVNHLQNGTYLLKVGEHTVKFIKN